MTKLAITINNSVFDVDVVADRTNPSCFHVVINGEPVSVNLPEPFDPAMLDWVMVNERPYELSCGQDLRYIQTEGSRYPVQVRDQQARFAVRPVSGDGRIKAPIPGLVTRLFVEPGASVEAGAPVLVLEAMKMENEVRAPKTGIVRQVLVKPGQSVKLFELLVAIE